MNMLVSAIYGRIITCMNVLTSVEGKKPRFFLNVKNTRKRNENCECQNKYLKRRLNKTNINFLKVFHPLKTY